MHKLAAIFFISAFLWMPGFMARAETSATGDYLVGVEDILEIQVLQPDKLDTVLTVSPDGMVTFPYIGNVVVKGLTLMQVQEKIQAGLAEYMKYPVVAVSLKESRSRIFYVYGEVNRPGSYPVQENLTVLRAVSLAGGFTRIAAMNNVKILRHAPDGKGDDTLSVDVGAAMNGKSQNDVKVEPGDVITVSQRFF
jgi:polysaccharide export outer membrane protein